jgi:hypothetical protein
MVNGKKPTPFHQASHECGKGHEGCFGASCLTWKTPHDNAMDRYKHGTMPLGERTHNAKLTVSAVIEIRTAPKDVTNVRLAEKFGVSVSTLSLARSGKKWAWVTG